MISQFFFPLLQLRLRLSWDSSYQLIHVVIVIGRKGKLSDPYDKYCDASYDRAYDNDFQFKLGLTLLTITIAMMTRMWTTEAWSWGCYFVVVFLLFQFASHATSSADRLSSILLVMKPHQIFSYNKLQQNWENSSPWNLREWKYATLRVSPRITSATILIGSFATFLSHGPKTEVNISPARTVDSSRFLN